MGLAETADLAIRINLTGNAKQGIRGLKSDLGGLKQSVGRMGSIAAQGARNAAANITKIGIVAAGGVALAVRGGISSLAELEDATTAVSGAIDQVGKGWKTTSQEIATWANEIEASVQAAFDDKEITQASTTLIRFGHVSENNLRPAMVVMTDLAAKTGDVGSASSLLAKALAAPEKAAGKLARVGVILTKQQQKQITEMVKAGDAAGAQTVLLDALAESTKGAAEASAGPYRDAMNILKDVTEDAQRALAIGFMPVLEKVADKLSKFLADPKNVKQIEAFGKTLAGGFEKLLEFAGRIPWSQIGDSLKIAGAGAKAVFDALTSLPPWIQTAVLTGWGLNKLTGGALTGLLGEGLKLTFSQFAGRGASPVNPIFTKEVGLAGGAGAAATGGAAYQLGRVLGTVMKVVGVIAIAELADQLEPAIVNLGRDLHKQLGLPDLSFNPNDLMWPFGTKGQPDWAGGDPNAPSFNKGTVVRAPTYAHPAAMREGHGSILTGEKLKADVDWAAFPGVRPGDLPGGKGANRPLTGSTFTAEQTKASVKWGEISQATKESNSRLSAVTHSVRERGIAMANKMDGVRGAVERIPPPRLTAITHVNTKTVVTVSAAQYARTQVQSGTWSSTQASAYNKGSRIGF